MKRATLTLLSPALFSTVLLSAPTLAAPPAAQTADAVVALDKAWLDAEVRGDGDFLDHLLLDGYVSVGTDGTVTPKARLVDGARKRGASAERAALVKQWQAAHPTRGDVAMFGDTAILSWVSTSPATAEHVSSVDIFVYRGGEWRAIYSQHSSAAS